MDHGSLLGQASAGIARLGQDSVEKNLRKEKYAWTKNCRLKGPFLPFGGPLDYGALGLWLERRAAAESRLVA